MRPAALNALRQGYDAAYKTGEAQLEPLFVGDWGPLHDPLVTPLSLSEAVRLITPKETPDAQEHS